MLAAARMTVVSVCALGVLGSPAWGDTSANFDFGPAAWRAAGPDPAGHIGADPPTTGVTWDTGTGQPAASIRVGEVFGWTWVEAPDYWLGNRTSGFGGSLSFDILIRFTDNIDYPAVALRGRDITLYHIEGSPGVGVWTSLSAPLIGSSWKVNNYQSGVVATDAQLLDVLSDLRGIYLLTEWNTGSDDTNVDNIIMSGSVAPVCTGDVNRDGQTNISDFNILAGNFGASVTANTSGDLTGDGLVNISDFNILAGNFGCGV